jgi:tetratricopeptide (TPR) repeat protein
MRKLLLLSFPLFLAVGAAAQAPIHISPEVKSNAREQIDTALPLIRAIERTKDPTARQLAVLQALSHLEVVPRAWPHDREAIVRAGLLEADVFARTNAIRNAFEVLDRIEALAARPAQRLEIAGRRGKALAKLGRIDEATAVFSAALAIRVGSPGERMPILDDAAAFYFFRKRNAELSHVLRELAVLDKNELSAAVLIARSLEANMREGNLTEARKDYADLAQRYARAQQLPVAPFGSGDAAVLQNLRMTLERFRARLGK